jgi:hypothetical protein
MLIDLHGVDYANDRRIDRTILAPKSHSRRAALDDKNNFLDAGSYRIDSDQMAFLIASVDAYHPSDQQLTPVQPLILTGGDHSTYYTREDHKLLFFA